MRPTHVLTLSLLVATSQAQTVTAPEKPAPVLLTIYNQDFAVARASVPLDLHTGMNQVSTSNVTSLLEPDSVVLRDPASRVPIQVSEQNYDAAVVTQEWLLEKFEGRTIDFQLPATATGPGAIVQGKILRAGRGQQPLIEVAGRMQFQLPGLPLFPAATDGLLLRPTLGWSIYAPKPLRLSAELDYITHGMGWQATYNVVAPESADVTGVEQAEVVGWVTIDNRSGTEFSEAKIKLMAGDVARVRDYSRLDRFSGGALGGVGASDFTMASPPPVTQKAFDDFHLYDLNRVVTLKNGETKQVQFLDATNVKLTRGYRYENGAGVHPNFYRGYHNVEPGYSAAPNTSVSVREELMNTASNHLGMPLPAGRLRVYRRDADGRLEFVGESMIQHTPAEATVQVVTGNAFDITAERKQTDFHVDQQARFVDESFEIRIKNQKAQPVTVDVIEHMNRTQNWRITDKSSEFTKDDSATAAWKIPVPAKGETTLSYSVRSTW